MHFMFMHLLFPPSRSRQDLSNKVINEIIWYNNLQLILINLASTMLIYLKNIFKNFTFTVTVQKWSIWFLDGKNRQPFCKTKFVEEKNFSTNYNIFEINLRLNQF